jgi:hypothetical protein
MEANENCSHTNYFLAPIYPNEHKKGMLQRFVCGKPIFSQCQIFSCVIFKYHISIQFYFFAAIATKNWNV